MPGLYTILCARTPRHDGAMPTKASNVLGTHALADWRNSTTPNLKARKKILQDYGTLLVVYHLPNCSAMPCHVLLCKDKKKGAR